MTGSLLDLCKYYGQCFYKTKEKVRKGMRILTWKEAQKINLRFIYERGDVIAITTRPEEVKKEAKQE